MRHLTHAILVCLMPALLSACDYPDRLNYQTSAITGRVAQVEARLIKQSLEMFKFDVGRYPTGDEGLQALLENPGVPGWSRPYLSNPATIEGVRYESDGETFKVFPKTKELFPNL